MLTSHLRFLDAMHKEIRIFRTSWLMYEEASFAYSLKSEWIIPLGWGGCHNRGFNLFTFTVESDLLPYGLEFSHLMSSGKLLLLASQPGYSTFRYA